MPYVASENLKCLVSTFANRFMHFFIVNLYVFLLRLILFKASEVITTIPLAFLILDCWGVFIFLYIDCLCFADHLSNASQ